MNALVTRSLEDEDVHLLFNFPREMVTKTEKRILEWVSTYTARFGSPPSMARLQTEFDTFIPIHSTDPLEDIYEQTLVRKRNIYVRTYITREQENLKAGADPLPMIEKLHQIIRSGASDVTRYSTYDRTAFLRKETSYPYEIEEIDKNTGGMAKGDLIYLIGRLGTGKTTFALWMLSKGLQRGRRFLMVSNENRADDVVAKIDSYIGGFNPINKRTRQWSERDQDRLKTVAYIASNMEGEVYIPNRPVQDIKQLMSLIYTYRPDIVMVDGIYLMSGAEGNSHWEKITNVSRSLKQIAEGEGLPVVGIHQASRNAVGKRVEIEHVAYADALAQDADLVLGINPEEDGSIFVESIKNRWGEKDFGFFLRFYFDTMSVRVLGTKTMVREDE